MTSFRQFALTGADTPLLDKMPAEQREVLTMWPGKTYDEIAGVQNVPVGTVRSRLHRARTLLAKLRAKAEPAHV